jgi:hypothetical protein
MEQQKLSLQNVCAQQFPYFSNTSVRIETIHTWGQPVDMGIKDK